MRKLWVGLTRVDAAPMIPHASLASLSTPPAGYLEANIAQMQAKGLASVQAFYEFAFLDQSGVGGILGEGLAGEGLAGKGLPLGFLPRDQNECHL